ncbi:8546_t:CDS:2 [Paraglomus brasilianum]|uniref:8546_t:CDS:1 n=1 Tax=Paraglomus brasilianum TaxID=144538 RepID=A0A9N9BKS1_9GLOM|nr:8546_t:CDS:2 [Paraglomus brasilianum]
MSTYTSTSINEFKEILNSEVYIDLDKLRDSARHGVPLEVRGEVWKYLLGVHPADRSQEITNLKEKYEEYLAIEKENTEIMKRVRGEIGRYQHKIKNQIDNKDYTNMLENVISAYMNHNREADYYPALVHLCGPFVNCIRNEAEVYYCFERLMNILDEYQSVHTINERVVNFMTLFRAVLPDLYSSFEDEEVDLNEWATSWLQFLLAKELPLEGLMRLWDTYFSIDDPIDFHPYVCLAVLKHCRESLEELEQSEIRTLLLRLPALEMGQIINQASNIRHEILERQISD